MSVLGPLGILRGGVEAKMQLFLEYGHVAYQIKLKEAYSIKEANILPVDPPPQICPVVDLFSNQRYI